jgi:DNA-binding Lrp family transcriptional regulator
MIDGWAETDDAIVECLRRAGSMSVAELARVVGLSEGEATTCICLLAGRGRVQLEGVRLREEHAVDSATVPRIAAGSRRRHRPAQSGSAAANSASITTRGTRQLKEDSEP